MHAINVDVATIVVLFMAKTCAIPTRRIAGNGTGPHLAPRVKRPTIPDRVASTAPSQSRDHVPVSVVDRERNIRPRLHEVYTTRAQTAGIQGQSPRIELTVSSIGIWRSDDSLTTVCAINVRVGRTTRVRQQYSQALRQRWHR
jgi:hypothetical protein